VHGYGLGEQGAVAVVADRDVEAVGARVPADPDPPRMRVFQHHQDAAAGNRLRTDRDLRRNKRLHVTARGELELE
jgi:hypothetical protein